MKNPFSAVFLYFVLFLELFVLIGAFLLYLLSSPKTLKFVMDTAIKELHIDYNHISGNLLKTITLTNLRYHDKLLAQEAEFDWNMRALLKGDMEIETLSLKFVDFKRIEELIQSQEQNNTQASQQKPSKLNLPKLSISHLYISTLPYNTPYVNLKTFEVDIYDINLHEESFAIKEFSIKTNNDLFSLQTNGTLEKKHLALEALSIDDVNLSHLEKSIALLPKSNPDDNTSTFNPVATFDVQKFKIRIKPYQYEGYHIHDLIIKSNKLQGDIKSLEFNATKLQIGTKTNLATMVLLGDVKSNHFIGQTHVNLKQKYFQNFTDIIDFASLNPLSAKISANPQEVNATLSLKSKQIFAGDFKNYHTAIKNLRSHIHYNIKEKNLKAFTDANVSSKYARNLQLKDTLTYHDSRLAYGGRIHISDLKDFPDYSLALFEKAFIDYHGDVKDLTANLHTDKLHLLYEMHDFNRADFSLESKPLEIAKYFPKIPKFLHPLLATASATMHLDFNDTSTLLLDTNITSNALKLTGKTTIHKGLVKTQTKATLVEKSFLSDIDKNMHLNKLFPADLNLSYQAQQLNITLDGKKHRIKDNFSYDINHSTLQNYLTLAGEDITLKGDINHLQLTAKIESLKTLQERLAPLYHFEKKPYDGALEINATITDTSQIEADIQSKWLVYEYSLNNFAFAEKVDLKLSQEGENLTLKSYSFNTYLDEDRRFFASKPSYFNLHQQKLSIESFWVNDQLRTFGAYDFQQQTGAFDTQTNQYHYKGKEGDITFRTSLQTTLDADKTHIQGNFHILKGLITYQSLNTHEIQSPDIIIIQEEKARLERAKESKSKLSLDITITSQQPLSYKVPKIDVALTPDIKIWKRPKKEVELLGRTTIHQGSYDEGNKHFDVLAGEILFGGDMHNPYLNIKAKHTNDPYVIDIDITGNLDAPIINFSANPYLSQSDILAMLLFSTTTESLFEGKKSSSSNQAITMLGNTFAKEIIKNFGLTLDRLVISTNEEGGLGIEVGKKVSQKITVIYSNDIVQSLKVRYQHSKHIETDIMISPESTGIDFIFKSEH